MVSKKRNNLKLEIMEQRLIKSLDEIKINDEIIISAYSNLKYLKVLRLPLKKDSTTFKVSLKRMQRGNGNWTWNVNMFEQDVAQHNHVMYQCLASRDVFLIKREENNN
jgi:hypothetical protein